MGQRRRKGFTLVEVMIVVLILGILAAILYPRFSNATETTRDTAAQTTLQFVRGQIELFKAEHGGIAPQPAAMWVLLQQRSDATETALTNPVGTKFGPYLKGTPINPWNGQTAVTSTASDATAGWYYTATPSTYDVRLRNIDGTVNTNY